MRKSPSGLGIVVLISALFVSACSVQSIFGPDDKAIVTDVQAKLFQDSVLKTRDIQVASNKGMVVLTGTVGTDLEKAAAERLASQASGVKQVDNQLTVSPSTEASNTQLTSEPAEQEQAPPERVAPPPPIRPRKRPRQRAVAEKPQIADASRDDSIVPKQEESAPEVVPQKPSEPADLNSTPPPPPPPPPPKPVHVTVPAGTVITVRMIDGVDSSINRAGQDFAASIASPVAVGDRVLIPTGSDARVRLVKAANAGHMTGQSELELELSSIAVAGNNYDAVTTTYNQTGASRGKRTAETVGGGAILGGLIGAIAGHGKGAAIGSVLGAGAGTAAEAGTKAPPMKVPSETKIDFTLKAPIRVTLPPESPRDKESQ